MDAITLKAYKWEVDETDDNVDIFIYGHTPENKTVTVKVSGFKPYIYLELDRRIKWTEVRVELFKGYLRKVMREANLPVKMRKVIKRKNYYMREAQFLWMAFPTMAAIRELEREVRKRPSIFGIGTNLKLVVHENRAGPLLQLWAMRKVKPAGWIKVKKNSKFADDEQLSTTDIEITCAFNDITPATINKKIRYKILSYDIECMSNDSSGNTFPDPTKSKDQTSHIGATVAYSDDPESNWKTYCLVAENDGRKIDESLMTDNTIVKHYKDEKSMLLGWTDFVNEIDPDIIIGYNTLSFDDNYLTERANKKLCWPRFSRLGRRIGQRSKTEERSWSSSAYGEQKFKFIDIPGRLHIDMFPVISKEYGNLSSYTLEAVSEHFLGEHKIDLPAKEMIQQWHKGDPRDLANIVMYCSQDTRLPMRLMRKLNSLIGLSEMANVVMVQMFDLVTRGQQIRVFSQVYTSVFDMGIVCVSKGTDYVATETEKEFVGATVQNPQVGFWELVATYDFCLTGDSLISLSNGTSKRIDQFSEKQNVLSYNEDRGFDNYLTTGKLLDKGKKETITLTLKYGQTITCTPDHKLLSSDGEWLEAKNLLGKKVVCGIQYPKDNICPLEKGWSLNGMDMLENREKTLAFCRLLGYAFGSINGTMIAQTLNVQTLHDEKIIKNDLKLLENNFENNFIGWPKFILDQNCPLSVLREFLAGFFGASCQAPDLINGAFSEIKIDWPRVDKNGEGERSNENILNELLKRFNIDSLQQISDKIGVRYATEKALKLYIVSLWSCQRHRGCQESPMEFLEDLNATDLFLTEMSPDAVIPSFEQTIVDIRQSGLEKVYDIQVPKSQNFLANGIVAHNCSLYPTTIIAYNLCFSTFVPPDEDPPKEDYHLIPLSEHIGCEHDTAIRKTKVTKKICKDYTYRFYKAHVKKGIIPMLLEWLLKARKETRLEIKRIKGEVDGGKMSAEEVAEAEFMMAVLDKRQLGYKVSANSVAGNTPVPCLIDGKFEYRTIEELGVDWRPDNSGNEVCQPKNIKIWSDKGWTDVRYVIRHPVKKPLKRILTHTGMVDCTEEHSLLRDTGEPVKPCDLVLGENLLHRNVKVKTLAKEIWKSKLAKVVQWKEEIVVTGQLQAAETLFLMNYLNEPGYISNVQNDKFTLKFGKPEKNFIREISNCPTKNIDYVYDVETENHHFAAGVGNMIVHNSMYGGFGSDYSYCPFYPAAASTTAMGRNSIQLAIDFAKNYRPDTILVYGDTDSCMLKFSDCNDLKECFKICEDMEKAINAIFPKPMYLELEKIYSKYFLLSKKRYIGYIVDPEGNLLTIDKKGVVIKRRDNCGFLRDVYSKLIEMVMAREPKWKFYKFLAQKINDLLHGNVDLEKLVITKSVKDSYKTTNLPHVAVAQKMRDRGKYVATGTRIRYIFVVTDNKKDPQYVKAEDPDYYTKNKDTIEIDYLYYLEKQLINPIDELIEVNFKVEKLLFNMLKLMKKGKITNVDQYLLPKFKIKK